MSDSNRPPDLTGDRSLNRSDFVSSPRVLFPSDQPSVPLNIAVRNSPGVDSPLRFFLLPEYAHDSMEEESSEADDIAVDNEAASIMETPGPPIREFRTEEKRRGVAEYLADMKRHGGRTCHYCNKEDCPDRFDIWWTRHRMVQKKITNNRCYNLSEEEVFGNAKRRQIFFEFYWATTRKLYNTRLWTPMDFMYIPKCAHVCARYFYPAPKHCYYLTFTDEAMVSHCNRGLVRLV